MNKNRITELIKKGYFVQDINHILTLNDEEFLTLINLLPKTKTPKILTKEEIINILNKNKITTFQYDIKIKKVELKSKITITDVISILKNRYNFLSSIIKKRLSFFNLLSINKISKKHKSFSIIGCVYKVSENKITLDDFSSKIDVNIYNKEYLKIIEEDCIIGAKCHWDNDTIICDEVIFPEFETNNNENNFKKLEEEIKKIKLEFITQNNLVLQTADVMDKDQNKITIILDMEYKLLSNNIIFLNASIPVNQIFINNFLFLVIDRQFVNFNFEKFVKLRLIESKIEKTIKFGNDIFLVEELPTSIILLNSNINSFEERNNIFLINVSKETKNFVVNFDKQTIEIFNT